MIIQKPHLLTRLEIYAPRYSDKHGELAEPVVLLAKYKVHHASSVMLIEFTKVKHLIGQRYCITRDKAVRCPVTTNGKIECYAVPFSALEGWESSKEVREIALSLFD